MTDRPRAADGKAKEPLRIAYIWSEELQEVADDLPSNVGRSSVVHGLIRALDLVEECDEISISRKAAGRQPGDSINHEDGPTPSPDERVKADEQDGQASEKVIRELDGASPTQAATVTHRTRSTDKDLKRASIVQPDGNLGTRDCILRYHDRGYVEALLRHRGESPVNDPTAPPPRQATSPSPSPSAGESSDQSSSASYSPPRHSAKRRRSSKSGSAATQPRRYPRTDPFNLSHDNPPFPNLPRYISLVAAATSTACRLLLPSSPLASDGPDADTAEYDITLCWDGGRHHAKRKEAGGFCYVNDLVLGILLLSREGRIPLPKDGDKAATVNNRSRPPRIMYLDLDLHYSDGVSSAFQSPTRYPPLSTADIGSSTGGHSTPLGTDNGGSTSQGKTNVKPPKPPSVLTLSVHHSSPVFFPPPSPPSLLPESDTPNPFSLSLPLAAYPSQPTYLAIWRQCIEPIYSAWDPDYIVLQLGVDGLPGDRVGQYGNWGMEGEGGIKWCVDQVKGWGKKLCITGGGGYHHANAARAWAGVTADLLGRETDVDTAIPHHEHFDAYEPSFTMEVAQSHMRDENTSEEINKAGEIYAVIAERIKRIVAAHS
ncbi:hypothetical protein IAU60_003925 [Kwoniella sp. DSM 27419]